VSAKQQFLETLEVEVERLQRGTSEEGYIADVLDAHLDAVQPMDTAKDVYLRAIIALRNLQERAQQAERRLSQQYNAAKGR
jgi:F420-0:gamma-glutamyl ligase-like protein